ncbi:MAG: MFS transporter [Clostridia bacterium]
MNKLWTRDFSILTIGSAVSMLGNAVSGFAMGLMIYDYTDSTLLFALFMVVYNLPKIILPLLVGPYMDRFSRKRVIYTLDFFSATVFLAITVLLYFNFFNYVAFLFMAIIIGSTDSIYIVAYESLYPSLITKGNYTKAYSVSSLIYPIATTIMVPIAGVFYETVGLVPLFAFNAISFFIAAIFETRIKTVEQHVQANLSQKFSIQRYKADFKDGISYLKREQGLLTIVAYFFCTTLASGAMGSLVLPFFKSTPGLGVQTYTLITSIATAGRMIGGFVQYRIKYPQHLKYYIAIFVYTAICFLDGTYLFLPIFMMFIFQFLVGVLGVTSYNIRISATQNYVTDDIRGRFNGIFQMITTLGMIIGQLLAGLLGEFFMEQYLILGFMIFNVIAIVVILLPRGEHVKKIYNNDV